MNGSLLRWFRQDGQKQDEYFFCDDSRKKGSSPDQRRKYDEAFKTEAPHLDFESRSTQAAAREFGISPKLLYRWQQARVVAEFGSVEVAHDREVRALRAANNGWRGSWTFIKKL